MKESDGKEHLRTRKSFTNLNPLKAPNRSVELSSGGFPFSGKVGGLEQAGVQGVGYSVTVRLVDMSVSYAREVLIGWSACRLLTRTSAQPITTSAAGGV